MFKCLNINQRSAELADVLDADNTVVETCIFVSDIACRNMKYDLRYITTTGKFTKLAHFQYTSCSQLRHCVIFGQKILLLGPIKWAGFCCIFYMGFVRKLAVHVGCAQSKVAKWWLLSYCHKEVRFLLIPPVNSGDHSSF